MKVLVLALVACAVTPSFAGRAYPQASQDYVTRLFKSVNPNIEWDTSNYVVDLSGFHAQCEYANMGGVSYESTRTRNGETITVIQDSGDGQEAHVNAVNSYIPPIMDDWTSRYGAHIRKAEKFGCSVQPGCQGRISIACLFAPSIKDQGEGPDTGDRKGNWRPNPLARAFTPEQYDLAEELTGKSWDRNHFLENLSAYDISCDDMVYGPRNKVTYEKAVTIAGDRGQRVRGVFGHSPNLGDTEDALVDILKAMTLPTGSDMVGCSLIADCKVQGKPMTVLASCVYKM